MKYAILLIVALSSFMYYELNPLLKEKMLLSGNASDSVVASSGTIGAESYPLCAQVSENLYEAVTVPCVIPAAKREAGPVAELHNMEVGRLQSLKPAVHIEFEDTYTSAPHEVYFEGCGGRLFHSAQEWRDQCWRNE